MDWPASDVAKLLWSIILLTIATGVGMVIQLLGGPFYLFLILPAVMILGLTLTLIAKVAEL